MLKLNSKLFIYVKILFFATIFSIFTQCPGLAENFTIEKYIVELNVQADGSIDVKEAIAANFHTFSPGIERQIPLYRTPGDKNGRRYPSKVKIKDLTVNRQYKTSIKNNNLIVKIGDNKNVKGLQKYLISYKYIPQYKYGDEFYFDIIQNNWNTEINKVEFLINMPKQFDNRKVYFLTNFEHLNLPVSYKRLNTSIQGQTKANLVSNQSFAIKINLDENYFPVSKNTNKNTGFNAFLITVFTLISVIFWYVYGKDSTSIPTVSFYPPKGLNPAQVGMIFNEKIENNLMPSLILYLASKGYIKITEGEIINENKFFARHSKDVFIKKNFYFEKLKNYDGKSAMLKLLMDEFFKHSPRTSLNVLDVDFMLRGVHKKIREMFTDFYTKIFDKDSISFKVKIAPCLCTLFLGFLLFYNLFSHDTLVMIFISIFKNFKFTCFFIFMLFVSIPTISKLFKHKKNISGHLQVVTYTLALIMILMMADNILNISISLTDNFALLTYNIIAFIVSLVCLKNLPKKNSLGQKIYGEILGFKKFIETAEKSKIEMLIKDNPDYCYDIIPYAYVLGVSVKWNEKINNIANSPFWFDGEFSNDCYDVFCSQLLDVLIPTETGKPCENSNI